MALTDFDAPPPGYAFTGSYNPDGSRATQYYGGGHLPTNFNHGVFNPDGTLQAGWNATDPVNSNPAPYAQATPWAVQRPALPRAGGGIGFNLFGQNPGATSLSAPLFASQKSAQVASALGSAFTDRAANQAAAKQTLTDFTKEFIASRPQVQQAANQEMGSIDSMYGSGPGSVQAQLHALNLQQQASINQAAQSAMARAGRANSMRRLQSPNSSYLDHLYGQDLRNVAVNAAGHGAEQGRADLQYLNSNRQGLVGRRQQIIDSVLNRGFAPMNAANQVETNNLGQIGGLAGLEYGNNVYSAPEDAYTKRLNFIQDMINRGYQ